MASVLEASIKAIGIPPRPLIIDRIKAAMNEEVPNFKAVGQLISADVSLASGLILKTAVTRYRQHDVPEVDARQAAQFRRGHA